MATWGQNLYTHGRISNGATQNVAKTWLPVLLLMEFCRQRCTFCFSLLSDGITPSQRRDGFLRAYTHTRKHTSHTWLLVHVLLLLGLRAPPPPGNRYWLLLLMMNLFHHHPRLESVGRQQKGRKQDWPDLQCDYYEWIFFVLVATHIRTVVCQIVSLFSLLIFLVWTFNVAAL